MNDSDLSAMSPTAYRRYRRRYVGNPDYSVCADPNRGTCADGFATFVDHLSGNEGED